jgi:hypothetical protein
MLPHDLNRCRTHLYDRLAPNLRGDDGPAWAALSGGQALHVIQRGNDRQPVFLRDDDYDVTVSI